MLFALVLRAQFTASQDVTAFHLSGFVFSHAVYTTRVRATLVEKGGGPCEGGVVFGDGGRLFCGGHVPSGGRKSSCLPAALLWQHTPGSGGNWRRHRMAFACKLGHGSWHRQEPCRGWGQAEVCQGTAPACCNGQVL